MVNTVYDNNSYDESYGEDTSAAVETEISIEDEIAKLRDAFDNAVNAVIKLKEAAADKCEREIERDILRSMWYMPTAVRPVRPAFDRRYMMAIRRGVRAM